MPRPHRFPWWHIAFAGLVLAAPVLAGNPAETLPGVYSIPAPEPPELRLVNPFNLFRQVTIRGGLAVGATCINFQDSTLGGPTGGQIPLTTVPAGATVLEAYIYYTVLSDSFPVPAGAPAIDGNPVTPVPLGSVPRSPCFPEANTGTFRLDVTPYVYGNGTYILSGFVGNGTGSGDITEGATLFVLYCDPASPLTDVVIWEGTDCVNGSETTFSQDITGFLADPAGPPTAFLGAAVGNGQMILPPFRDGADPFVFNGTDLDQIHPEILSGGLCPGSYYDLIAYDVSPYVLSGSMQATLRVTLDQDCYTFAAIALAVSTDQTRTDDACNISPCGARLFPEVTPPVSCDGSAVTVNLKGTFSNCPPGALETAVQLDDPLTALDSTVSSDLGPPTTSPVAAQARLTYDLTGDTNLQDCVEVSFIDPLGTLTVVKAIGAPDANPYDVTPLYTGPGTYVVQLTEIAQCGGGPNRFAVISTATLEVWGNSGGPKIEYQVTDAAGTPVCDWNPDPLCLVPPNPCPGVGIFVGRGRCTYDPACGAEAQFEVRCSGILADFSGSASCDSTVVCFQNLTTGGLGAITWLWDFAGQGTSKDKDPCFTFSGAPPWLVNLTATDGTGCESTAKIPVSGGTGTPPPEPSALDRNPGATPFRIAKQGGQLALSWEDLGAGIHYSLYRGNIGTWYSHGKLACDVAQPSGVVPDDPGTFYFLAVGSACAGTLESSYGRSSWGAERPTGTQASGSNCP